MRFRLKEKDDMGNKVGPHCMGPVRDQKWARVVKPGEVIESDQPLDELFRNKFERLDADPEPEAEPQPKGKGRNRK